jgi:hypothetical protein
LISVVLDPKFCAVSVTELRIIFQNEDCNFTDGCTWGVRTDSKGAATGITFIVTKF